MVGKALESAADRVLLDLEDAVDPSRKDIARASTVELLGSLDADARSRVSVRVNAVGTGWSHKDLIALASTLTPPGSIVLPKAEPRGVAYAERLLSDIDADLERTQPGDGPALELLIESAEGVAYVGSALRAEPRVSTLILGYADLAASLGRPDVGPPESWLPIQQAVVTAARRSNIATIDGPHLGTAVDDDFLATVRLAYLLGFDGKWVIHPRQIDAVNEAFTPSANQVDWAHQVLEALQHGSSEQRGAVQLNGQMLDEAVAVAARQLLTRAGES
jgi:citrate lyase subunit beta/citryl-CoA lyase